MIDFFDISSPMGNSYESQFEKISDIQLLFYFIDQSKLKYDKKEIYKKGDIITIYPSTCSDKKNYSGKVYKFVFDNGGNLLKNGIADLEQQR